MSLLRQKAPLIREKRLNAIAAYYGKAETLLQENASEDQFLQRVRTYSQDAPSDILYALSIIATIKDAAAMKKRLTKDAGKNSELIREMSSLSRSIKLPAP